MKEKIKKILMVMLTSTICVASLVGCGSKVDEDKVENILKAKEKLIAAENISLTRTISTEIEDENQSYGSDVIANMNTKEWYFGMFNNIDGEKAIFTKMIVLDGDTYNRTIEQSQWEKLEGQQNNHIYGVEDIAAIEINAKDLKELKESKDGENTLISLNYTKDAIKKVKEENVKNMEETMEAYKNNPNVMPGAVDSNMANLEALRKTNYKEMTNTLTIDKSGVLIGYNSYFVFEQPEVLPSKDGKFELGKDLIELKMTSNITVNSYNDKKNTELIEGFKQEVGR